MNKKIMIIGGDDRFAYMKTVLENEGHTVMRIYPGDYTADAFNRIDLFILPVPVSRDRLNVNTPSAGEFFPLRDMIRLLPEGCAVAGGLIDESLAEKLKKKNIRVFDYYKDASLAERNAVPTAEGVIGILINTLPVTLDSLCCTVTGYGRCAKEISKKLRAMGAKVNVCARSESAVNDANDAGINAVCMSELKNICKKSDVIINTVPATILDRKILCNAKKDCLLIEVASAPFGIDFDCAKELGLNVIKAGSLPGKTAPLTAAKLIANTVMADIEEWSR